MKLFLALFVLAAAGLAGWYGYSPYPVMKRFQAAVDSGKPEAVAPFLDVPSLKSNVAQFVQERYGRKANPATGMDPDQIQGLVDQYVTPQTVLLLMQGEKDEPGTNPPDQPDGKPHPVVKHYLSPDVFAVDVYLSDVKTPDNKESLLFQREGWFDWKLAAFRFAWNG
jgi:Protein of unknown function (DUF2939)